MVVLQIVGTLVVFLIIFDIYFSLSCLHQASILVNNTNHRGEHYYPSVSNKTYNILVEGDSVAVGVGSSAFHRSVAGKIGGTFTENYTVNLFNNAISGSKVKDLLDKDIPGDKQYDLVVLIVGSNDLFKFSWIREFRDPVHELYKKYSKVGKKVIVIGPGIVHETSGVPKLSLPLYKFMGPLYGRVMAEEADEFPNVIHVNPFDTLDINSYGNTEAEDHFHPNDTGHQYWYDLFLIGLERAGIKY